MVQSRAGRAAIGSVHQGLDPSGSISHPRFFDVGCSEKTNTITHKLNNTCGLTAQSGISDYLKAIGDVEFGRRDSHEIIHQHHNHDGDEDGEITDGRPHLQRNTGVSAPSSTAGRRQRSRHRTTAEAPCGRIQKSCFYRSMENNDPINAAD